MEEHLFYRAVDEEDINSMEKHELDKVTYVDWKKFESGRIDGTYFRNINVISSTGDLETLVVVALFPIDEQTWDMETEHGQLSLYLPGNVCISTPRKPW